VPSGSQSAPEFCASPKSSEWNTLATLPVAAQDPEPDKTMYLEWDFETVRQVPLELLEWGEHNIHTQLPAGYWVNVVSGS